MKKMLNEGNQIHNFISSTGPDDRGGGVQNWIGCVSGPVLGQND